MDVPRIMVFRPSYAEFQNFPEYIAYMERCGAHKAGLAKVCNFILYKHFLTVIVNRFVIICELCCIALNRLFRH